MTPLAYDVTLYGFMYSDQLKYFTDDYCLLLLLKGVCLRHQSQRLQAKQCFEEVISL